MTFFHNRFIYKVFLVFLLPMAVMAQQQTNLTLNNETITAGQERLIRATNTITASNYTIQDGGDVVFEAGQEIVLNPGFTTEGMASFEASIEYMGVSDAGTTLGNFSVDEAGGAGYSIPITVSPGTAGTEPKLSFVYNSHSKDGLLGPGWGISGLSMITRVPTTVAQDGYLDVVDFDASDRFALDGERLMGISGTYGANGSQYYTEQHSFSKIISYGSVGSGSTAGPEKFIVYTKSGLIMEYGYTTDSRVEAVNRTDVMTWALNKVTDTKGNYITFNYYEYNSAGQHYIESIDYTGNANTGLLPYASVEFEYENNPYPYFQYFAGDKTYRIKRLKGVKSFYEDNLVRQYKLTYEQPGVFTNTKFVMSLKSVQECGYDGTCFEPTTFDYNTDYTGLSASGGFYVSREPGHEVQDARHLVGDFNGNGRTDIIYQREGTNEYWYLGGSLWGTRANGIIGQNQIVGDFDGDGISDIAYVKSGTSDLHVMRKPAGGSFSDQKWITLNFGFAQPVNMWITDINFDGRADILLGDQLSSSYISVISTGTGFTQSTWGSFSASHLADAGFIPFPMDVDGDGSVEVIYKRNGTKEYWAMVKGQSNLLLGTADFDPEYNKVWPMDVNNDGLMDFVYKKSGGDASYHAMVNTGAGLEDHYWGDGSTNTIDYSGEHWAVDVNRDGFVDLTYKRSGSSSYYALLNNGSEFNQIEWGAYSGTAGYSGMHLITDINGDGVAELTYNVDGAGYYGQFKANASNRLLKKITNGHDAKVNITYSSLAHQSATLYTKGNSASFPDLDISPAMEVVSRVTQSNGNGGLVYSSFKYYEAVFNLQGRGFRGFKRVDRINATMDTESRTYYNTDYRYVGSRVTQMEEYADGNLVSRTINTPGLISSYGNGVYFSYIDASSNTTWELNGNQVSTTYTQYDYDTYGNATRVKIQKGADYTETFNTFSNNTTNWHLGRLTQSLVTSYRYFGGTGTGLQRKSTFSYNSTTGLLEQEILEPDVSTLKLTKNYTHDAYGNVTYSETIGWNGSINETRGLTTTYDARGRFVTSTTNALGHTSTEEHENLLGNLVSQTGPNGLTSEWRYGPFGRLISSKGPDGNLSTTSYLLTSESFAYADDIVYKVVTTTPGAATTTAYFDNLDREVAVSTIGLDGTVIITEKVFNGKGMVWYSTDPYFLGTSLGSIKYTTYTYDDLGRLLTETAPGNRVSSNTYQGRTTISTNPLGQQTRYSYDQNGLLIATEDNLGNVRSYFYDDFGNLENVYDLSQFPNTIPVYLTQTHDKLGNKTQMQDPNMGTTAYSYNAFGELISTTDAKSQTVTLTYDKLGRIKTRVEPEGTTTWTYDSGNKAIGKLTSVSSPGGQSESYTYDNLGRPSTTTVNNNGTNYTTTTNYDSYSRVSKIVYPSGFAIKHVYNTYGYLTEVRKDSDNSLYWQLNTINAKGQYLQQTLGNSKVITQTFDANKGTLSSISVPGVQNMAFTFNDIGSLTLRQDLLNSHSESFQYDGLNRLTSATLNGGAYVAVTYDDLGNITYRSDLGCYVYGENGAGINALTSILDGSNNVIRSYTYDANGNRITSTGGSVSYTSFNKPLAITEGNQSLHYTYGPMHSKRSMVVKRNGVVQSTRKYINSIYEEEIEGSVTRKIHYIVGGDGVVATYTTSNVGPDETRYLHKDHLGSVVAISNESGTVVENISYDAWGKRRNSNWTATSTSVYSDYNRGFTGHEQLEEVKLVHMNGRVYDPEVGRFLSPDPFIQSPEFSQSFNRYTYVFNNPLSLTDPTGYISQELKTIIGLAAGALTGGIAGQIWQHGIANIIASGAGVGFGQAVSGALLDGNSLGKSLGKGLVAAAIGGSSAFLTTKVGDVFQTGNPWNKVMAHGMVQGMASVVSGGEFKHGYLSGVVGAIIGDIPKSAGIPQIVAAAVGSGTVAELSGGKFANGAMSGAFVVLFNHAVHQDRRPPKVDLNGSDSEVFEGLLKWASYLDLGAIVRTPSNNYEDFFNLTEIMDLPKRSWTESWTLGPKKTLVRKLFVGDDVITLTIANPDDFRAMRSIRQFRVSGMEGRGIRSVQRTYIFFQSGRNNAGGMNTPFTILVNGPSWNSIGRRVFKSNWGPY